ncbi:MAG: redoxin [Rhodovulum sp.]|nr:redoxin [Rhodovulum sp.]|tara:strand:- start:1611 stop:2183 length:573 start_codon:yes stop_codon:yes gene_type:complete
MRILRSVVLYTALALGANAALAETADIAALRQGDMLKLNVHAEPQPIPIIAPLETLDGAPVTLAEYQGKYVVVNFWATWCAPCRKEMPGLDRLQTELAGEDFEVVTIAVGRLSVPGIHRFFEETGVENVVALRDPFAILSRQMSVLGLPVTVIMDPEGREIARLIGEAEWDGPNARVILDELLDREEIPS